MRKKGEEEKGSRRWALERSRNKREEKGGLMDVERGVCFGGGVRQRKRGKMGSSRKKQLGDESEKDIQR